MPKKYTRKPKVTRKNKRKVKSGFASANPPPSKKLFFKYSEFVSLPSPTATTFAIQKYRLNSLYDPNQTVGAPGEHQPYGFDEWTNFYSKYLVMGAHIKVSGQCQHPCRVAIVLQNEVTTAASLNQAIESGIQKNLVTTGFNNTFNTSIYVPNHKIAGVSLAKYKIDDSFSGLSMSSSPADGQYLLIYIQETSQTLISVNDIRVEITYDSVLYDRKQLPTSAL